MYIREDELLSFLTFSSHNFVVYLRENKVPTVLFSEFLESKFGGEELKDFLREEKAKYNEQRNEYLKVKTCIEKIGVDPILIKSPGHFTYESDNIDVLVPIEYHKEVRSCLRSCGYFEIKNAEEPNKFLFRKFIKGNPFFTFHLHGKVEWVNSFLDERLVYRRRRKSPHDHELSIPSYEDLLLILVAHFFYEDKQLKLRDIINLREALGKNLDWEYIISQAQLKGWLDGLLCGLCLIGHVEKRILGKTYIPEFILNLCEKRIPPPLKLYFYNLLDRRRDLALPLKFSKLLIKSLHLLKTLKDKTTSPKEKIREIRILIEAALRLKFNLRYQKPFIVAFSGADGCGKTTLANKLIQTLKLLNIKTTYSWDRPGTPLFLRPLVNILKREPAPTSNSNPSTLSKTYGFLLFLLFLSKIKFKVIIGKLLNRIVVFDRFILDGMLDVYVKYGVPLESGVYRVLGRFFPKPDIAFYIDVREEVLFERTGEDLEGLVKLVSLYKKFVNRGFCIIDNNQGVDDAFDCVLKIFLEDYFEKKEWKVW